MADLPLSYLKKGTATITHKDYLTPYTNPLVFYFEPSSDPSLAQRLHQSSTKHLTIDEKDIYVLDHFFSSAEITQLYTFSAQAHFGRHIYADHTSKEQGESADRAMDPQEKWRFFSSPPSPVQELYRFLGWIAQALNCEVATLPWELHNGKICAPAVTTNRVEHKSEASSHLGKHQDYDPKKGLPFGIPILYAPETSLYPSCFENGATGHPWLVSLMLYATSDQFQPHHGLGTVFYNNEGRIITSVESCPGRLVLFEGDLLHAIASAQQTPSPDIWRVSYVFKLMLNPRSADQNIKQAFLHMLTKNRGTCRL